MRTIKSALFVIIVSLLVFVSCSKQNEETLIMESGGIDTCNTVNMKYAADIKPILQTNCYPCHGNGRRAAGLALDSIAVVRMVAENGRLIGAITHTPGYIPMPRNRPKLSDCNINKIKDWVNSGTPNN